MSLFSSLEKSAFYFDLLVDLFIRVGLDDFLDSSLAFAFVETFSGCLRFLLFGSEAVTIYSVSSFIFYSYIELSIFALLLIIFSVYS